MDRIDDEAQCISLGTLRIEFKKCNPILVNGKIPTNDIYSQKLKYI